MSAARMVPSRIRTSYSWPVRLSRTVRVSWDPVDPVAPVLLDVVAVSSVTSAPRSWCPARLSRGGRGQSGGRFDLQFSALVVTRVTYARNLRVWTSGDRFDLGPHAPVFLTVAAAHVRSST